MSAAGYNHQHYQLRRRLLRFLLRTIGFTLLARIEGVQGLQNIPASGPAILMINHIAFVDPIAVLHVLPRQVTPMAKIEVYSYPVIGLFPRIWGVIPVHREEADRRAIQQALSVLRAGEMILVAPEATRSPQLQTGKEGIAYLATRADAPIIPVAIEGTPGFPCLPFSARWRGPGIQLNFGRPFRFRHAGPGRPDLRQMTDEAMYLLAAMLPPERRGVYSDLSQASQDTVEFLD
jgi:1-acyl-sn-glycerol-3-phosphate acyltransferase